MFIVTPKLEAVLKLLVETIPGLTYEFTEEGCVIHIDDSGAKLLEQIREHDVQWLEELCLIIRHRRKEEKK